MASTMYHNAHHFSYQWRGDSHLASYTVCGDDEEAVIDEGQLGKFVQDVEVIALLFWKSTLGYLMTSI